VLPKSSETSIFSFLEENPDLFCYIGCTIRYDMV